MSRLNDVALLSVHFLDSCKRSFEAVRNSSYAGNPCCSGLGEAIFEKAFELDVVSEANKLQKRINELMSRFVAQIEMEAVASRTNLLTRQLKSRCCVARHTTSIPGFMLWQS
jgi:hypothetical protein